VGPGLTSVGAPVLRAPALPHPLTEPDVEILRLLARGLPVETVARRLEISDRTVRRRCRQVCDRLGVHTPIEAVVWAAHHHLV
jgi:DNA-binding NarL/FixJ family response regulator